MDILRPDFDSARYFENIKNGDKAAFKIVFDKYYTDLCRFGYIYIKDKDAVENIVQDIFVNLWIKREEVNIQTSLKSYLFTSVKNRAFNYHRDNKKNLNFDDYFDTLDSQSDNQYAENIEFNELKDIINNAIDKLPPKCAEIFRLSRFEYLSYKEIAEKLEVSPKTVENQIGIALKKLHESLKPYIGLMILAFIIILFGIF